MSNLPVTVAILGLMALSSAACGDDAGGSTGGGAGGSSSDGGSAADGGSRGDGGSSSDGGGPSTGSSPSSSSTASGTTSQAGTSTADVGSTNTVAAATSTTGSGGDDEYAAQRQICVDKINQLRATESLPAYGRWGDAEECSDGEVTSDEQSGTPHGAFGTCGEFGQDECLGHGPDGVSQCLDQMWAEKDLPECSGCSQCHAQQGGCADCVFQSCGHYVNMSALYFTEVACGFSDLGGWDVQNFR